MYIRIIHCQDIDISKDATGILEAYFKTDSIIPDISLYGSHKILRIILGTRNKNRGAIPRIIMAGINGTITRFIKGAIADTVPK